MSTKIFGACLRFFFCSDSKYYFQVSYSVLIFGLNFQVVGLVAEAISSSLDNNHVNEMHNWHPVCWWWLSFLCFLALFLKSVTSILPLRYNFVIQFHFCGRYQIISHSMWTFLSAIIKRSCLLFEALVRLKLLLLQALTVWCWVFLVQLMKLGSYWVLAVCFGGGIGLLSTLVTVLDQLLCPHGYSDVSILISVFYFLYDTTWASIYNCSFCKEFRAKSMFVIWYVFIVL